MKTAREPFHWVAAFHLVRICSEKAENLQQLASALRQVSDASIFYHTFQSMELHHPVAFANDFARWSMAACNQSQLAERLGGIDLRGFISLAELRKELVEIVASHVEAFPEISRQKAFEPFYFCESQETVIPINTYARNLEDLMEGVRGMSRQTFHYHMINSRLRLQLRTTDFSNWIEKSLDLPKAAEELNRLDIYLNTVEDLRQDVLNVLQRWAEQ